MDSSFAALTAAAVFWFVIHPGLAGSRLRGVVARRIGDKGFRALFAMLSVLGLSLLIFQYSRAGFLPLWFAPRLFFYVPLIVVPFAFVLLIGAFTVPNPTAVGGERALQKSEASRGMLRVTRHPFLWAVALWAGAHLLVNGDLASVLFFGSLGTTALVGTRDIDRKRARVMGERWTEFSSVTSNVPFGAIVSRRNSFVWRETLLPIVLGLLMAGLFLAFHGQLFGSPALPSASGACDDAPLVRRVRAFGPQCAELT